MAPVSTQSDPGTDSSSLPEIPSDEAIDKALRDAVSGIFQSASLHQLTVRRVRSTAEKSLGLGEGFLKGHGPWKEKSAHIIKDQVVCKLPANTAPWNSNSDMLFLLANS